MADITHERIKRLGHRADAPVPTSTYRLQLTADFTFADAAAQLPYFKALGVSHLYLSPILQASPGSTHFYDVVDHSRIADVLGGEAGLRDLSWRAGEHGIGLIADIVPNHMAVPTPAYFNRALWSVLAEGAESPYAHWFDVDWSAGEPVLMAVLGERMGTVLAKNQLTVGSMVIPGHEDDGAVPLLRYFDHTFPVRPGTENLPMESLVDQQHYRLAYWRVGNEELNYRRFFDVGSLVGLRVEDPDVFEKTHRVIIDLIHDGTLTGLRVDHPDGLADPETYLADLAEATDGAWIVVEKILEDDERLPTSWKTAGTTGYDAAWRIGGTLRDPSGAAPLAGTLHRVAGDAMGELPALIDIAKREIVEDSLASETERLATLAHTVCTTDVRLRDHTWRALYDCVRTLVIAFHRYRAYVSPGTPPKPTSVEAMDAAAARARLMLDPERHETLDVLVELLKGNEVGSAGRTEEAMRAQLITRFQQVCGAVMAKGVEDTAYYRWTHLLPLCEVGSPAGRFALPPAAFHTFASDRQQMYPHAMTTLTTHDIKRSGDIRARLGVLSELADDWDGWITKAREASAGVRPAELDGRTENLWWQTLVGTVDHDGALMEWDRLEGYLIKAMREAKSFTSWTSVNAAYESAVLWFCQTTHADPLMRGLVNDWTAQSATGVRAAVLSQALMHLTMPGVPDLYQGTESYRALLVDPDNRRAVDFGHLAAALARVSRKSKPRGLADEKLLVTARALELRNTYREAFLGDDSGYLALPSSSGNAVVYARTTRDEPTVVAVATRAAIELDRLGGWRGHTVQLPAGDWVDVLTRQAVPGGAVDVEALLPTLPVALLVRA
jgi:(1->4)-alpha-D-glucan 1-alpha-D-glucosylmutase